MTDNRERIEALKAQVEPFRFDPNQKRDGHGRWGDGPGGGLRDKVKKLKDKIKGKDDLGDDKPKGGGGGGGYTEVRKARDLKPGDEIEGLGTVKQNLGTDLLDEQMILTDKGEHSLSPNEDVKIRPKK